MACRQGATPEQILRHGDWTNLGTYQRFYNRDIRDVPVGRLILQSSQCKFFIWVIFCILIFRKLDVHLEACDVTCTAVHSPVAFHKEEHC